TTWRSKPTATRSFRSRTAQSSPPYTGVTFRRRKTTKSLAVPNPSLLGPPRTFSSWSRTPRSTPRPEAGGSLISTKTAHLATRPCSKHALLATRRLLATLSSPNTHLHIENHIHTISDVQRDLPKRNGPYGPEIRKCRPQQQPAPRLPRP